MKYELIRYNTPYKQQLKIPLPTKKSQSTVQSPTKDNTIQIKINSIYHSEFEEEFSLILLLSQEDFLTKVFSVSIQKIRDILLPSELFLKPIKDMIENEESSIRTIYLHKYKLLSTALNDYEANKTMILKYSKHLSSKNNDRFSFLKHFRKHCPLTDAIARHSCHSSNSKFLEVTEESSANKEELLTHVICISCKKCYPISCVELYCNHCECDYYSSLLSPSDRVDILPATWKKYHCGSMVNEMMKCIQCRETLYLNCKSLLLMCLNKKCNFVSEQHSIIWKCAICKKDFNSDAKIYNPLEFYVMKKAIRNAMIIKQPAYPYSMKCCCSKSAPSELSFYHKKGCSGVLYKGICNNADIVVCGKCKAINYYDKFVWTCPLCEKRFKNEASTIQEGEESQKNIFPKRNSLCDQRIQSIEVNTITMTNKDKDKVEDNDQSDENYRKSFVKKRRSSQYNTLMDILDERKGERSTIRETHHGATKSGDFRCMSIYSSDIKEELENIPKKICFNLLESFNIVNTKNENPLFLELECLNNQRNNQRQKEKEKSQIVNVTESKIPLKASSKDVNEVARNAKNSSKESNKPNDIIIRNNNNKSDKIKVNNAIMRGKENEKRIEAIQDSSTIPLFDMETVSIIKSIGEGSFGKIYLIEYPNSKSRFALKKIITHNIEEAKAVQKEFELMYSAQHDNIMKIFNIQYKLLDFSTYSIYVLMELAESDWNVEIKSRSTRSKYYKEADLISIIKQLTEALAFLQKRSISHRDIKPQNVLLYKHSIVKMADFGEAKEIKKTKQECTLRGTELYMSPILYEGLKKSKEDVVHDPYRSDVFSLGYCVLYASTLNPNVINDLREITNMKKYKEIIEKHLKNRYSTKFMGILLQMLEIDEQKRIDFIELENQLKFNYP